MFIVLLINLIQQIASKFLFLSILHQFFKTGIKAVVSSLMIQTLIPEYMLIGNGAAWFISCIFIIYLFCPLILFLFNKIKFSAVKAVLAFLVCVLIIFLCDYCVLKINTIINYDDFCAFYYTYPFFRLIDFTAGIFLGILFSEVKSSKKLYKFDYSNNKIRFFLFSLIEFFSFILPFYLSSISIKTFPLEQKFIYAFFMGILVFCLALEQGCISKILKTKFFNFLGSISMEFYLLHYFFFILTGKSQYKLFTYCSKYFSYSWLLFLVINLLAVIFLSVIWKNIEKKLKIHELFLGLIQKFICILFPKYVSK